MTRFLILFCCAFLLPSLSEAKDDRFSVNVSVDVTDKNAAIARERAMAEAHRAAFNQVAKKITSDESAQRLAALPAEQLVNFIREVSVLDEKSSAVRYIATLKVNVNEDLLKTYMKEQEMPFLVQGTSRILVIPVYEGGNGTPPLLWENENIWYNIWQNVSGENNVSFFPIPKTGANMSAIDVGQALALDDEALGKIYNINGVDDVYVVAVTPLSGGLQIRLHSYKNGTNAFEGLNTNTAELSEAARAVVSKIARQNRNAAVFQEKEQHEAVVLYDYEGLADMVNVENRLKEIPNILKLKTEAVSGNRAQYRLVYAGSPERLLQTLRAKHFILQDYDDFFVLHKI